jgi:hypothetical protein
MVTLKLQTLVGGELEYLIEVEYPSKEIAHEAGRVIWVAVRNSLRETMADDYVQSKGE